MNEKLSGKVQEIIKGKKYKIIVYLKKGGTGKTPPRKTKVLDNYAKPNLEKTTYQAYRKEITRHMIPIMGHIPLCYLTPLHIQEYYNYLAENGKLVKKGNEVIRSGGLSARAITYQHAILRQALEKAVDLELIPKNPCTKAKPPRSKKHPGQAWVPMTKEELREFLKGFEGHRDYAIVYTAAYTGMRQSELLGLTWSDILWDEKTIRVNKALHLSDDEEKFEHRERTKNVSSTRNVKITDRVINVLKEHRKKQLELQLASGGEFNNQNNLVFPNIRNGGYEDRRNLHHRFVNMAEKLGYPDLTFHHLRHIHATILLSAGEYINAVSERLGHNDSFTTLKIYAHVLPNKQEEVANHFDQLMSE
ncbi:MAG: tyrosine-type recombinase/integrase [Bacillota bacterium]|jgi:integrase